MIEFGINKTVLQIIMVQNCQRSIQWLIVIVVAFGVCWLYLILCAGYILSFADSTSSSTSSDGKSCSDVEKVTDRFRLFLLLPSSGGANCSDLVAEQMEAFRLLFRVDVCSGGANCSDLRLRRGGGANCSDLEIEDELVMLSRLVLYEWSRPLCFRCIPISSSSKAMPTMFFSRSVVSTKTIVQAADASQRTALAKAKRTKWLPPQENWSGFQNKK